MNEALQLIYYTLNKFITWIFSSYLFSGVSLGMVLLVCFIFVIMLRYLLAVPKIRVGFSRNREGSSDSE